MNGILVEQRRTLCFPIASLPYLSWTGFWFMRRYMVYPPW